MMLNLEYVGTVRLDACSNVLWRLPAQGHHSISQTDDGTFWIPGGEWSTDVNNLGNYPGFPSRFWMSKILHVSQGGNVIGEINITDVLLESKLAWHIPKVWNLGGIGQDPVHINDVEPLPRSIAESYPTFEKGDLMVSARHINLVFVMDPVSRKIKWEFSRHLIDQHDPDFIGGGG
ncbi:MAG: arylsulfotransferase family protein [Candidatus Aenigmatarchaeota archaeon]